MFRFNFLRYRGLDLPIYPPETEVLEWSSQLPDAAATQLSFVRWINHSRYVGMSVVKVLRAANEIFCEVADGCNAKVIPYRVGMQVNPKLAKSEHGLPKNHILVAEVASIKPPDGHEKPLPPTSDQTYEIGLSAQRSRIRRTEAGKPAWNDGHPDQFWNGQIIAHTGIHLEVPYSYSGLILSDIEPLLAVYEKHK